MGTGLGLVGEVGESGGTALMSEPRGELEYTVSYTVMDEAGANRCAGHAGTPTSTTKGGFTPRMDALMLMDLCSFCTRCAYASTDRWSRPPSMAPESERETPFRAVASVGLLATMDRER